MPGKQEYDGFYANCNHQPGGDNRALRVGGRMECPTPGYSAHFEPTQGNTGIGQDILHLDLVVMAPGGTEPEVMTWIDIDEWMQAPPAREYQQVQFHRSDRDPPPIIDVDHVH